MPKGGRVWDEVKARHEAYDKRIQEENRKRFNVDPTPRTDRTPAKKPRNLVGGVRN